jgi:hypothetical protein
MLHRQLDAPGRGQPRERKRQQRIDVDLPAAGQQRSPSLLASTAATIPSAQVPGTRQRAARKRAWQHRSSDGPRKKRTMQRVRRAGYPDAFLEAIAVFVMVSV